MNATTKPPVASDAPGAVTTHEAASISLTAFPTPAVGGTSTVAAGARSVPHRQPVLARYA